MMHGSTLSPSQGWFCSSALQILAPQTPRALIARTLQVVRKCNPDMRSALIQTQAAAVTKETSVAHNFQLEQGTSGIGNSNRGGAAIDCIGRKSVQQRDIGCSTLPCR